MAIETITTSDLSGESPAQTITITIDGIAREIDLTSTEAAEVSVRTAYDAAHTPRRTPPKKPTSTGMSKQDNDECRSWAAANDYQIAPRGRVPKRVVEAWRAAKAATEETPPGTGAG